MAKVRVQVWGTIGKTVFIDTDLGPRVAALETRVSQITAAGGGAHAALSGLQSGDDHPQYTMWAAGETIRAPWNFEVVPLIEGETLAEYIEDVVGGGDFIQDTPSIEWTYGDTAGTLEANVVDDYIFDLIGGERDSAGEFTFGVDVTVAGRVIVDDQLYVNGLSRNVWRGDLNIQSTTPQVIFTELGVTEDNAWWDFAADAEAFLGRLINDANNVVANWLKVDRTGMTVDTVELFGQVIVPDGSATAPGMAFHSETNTGFCLAAAGQLTATSQGSQIGFWFANAPGAGRMTVSNTANDTNIALSVTHTGVAHRWQVLANGTCRLADGTVGAPGISFLNDTDNGLYRIGTNNWAASAAGALVTQWGSGFFDMVTAVRHTGTITPTQIAANTDNWNPTGLSTSNVIRASTDASRNLTGIVAQGAGTRILLCNVGAQDLVLVHDATSTAANRFLCPGSANFTLNANDAVYIWYDTTSARWRVVAF